MSTKLFPTLQLGVVSNHLKTSLQNMDNVFNSLMNLSSYNTSEHMSQFRSILTITYNRIQVLFNEDPNLCLKTLKLYSKWYIEYIRGVKEDNPGVASWHWDSVNNYPIMLADLIEFMDAKLVDDAETLLLMNRLVIALLSLNRVMTIPGKPDYTTITKLGSAYDPTNELYPSDIGVLWTNLGFTVKEFRERYDYECKTFEYRIMSSAGVNGDATWTAHSDAIAWLEHQNLLNHFKQFSSASNLNQIFTDLIGTVPVSGIDKRGTTGYRLGRLHSFDELGGKVRTVAIVDYWTQMLFSPLHNTINHFLKRMETDGTFDQNALASRIRSWTADKLEGINSFDLTAATDRLPVNLQVDILAHLLGNRDLAENWRRILVNRVYWTSDEHFVQYTVGQPMGARSSFAMLALTHHMIVQHAAKLSNISNYTQYGVLGDDMTQVGTTVGIKYREIMNYLGVPINLSKSVTHSGSKLAAAEICKRVFIEGNEITSIPVKLIAKTVRENSLAPMLHSEFITKGFVFTEEAWMGFFYAILNEMAFKDLVTLNILPLSVSGLSGQVALPSVDISTLKNWYPSLTDFDASKIENVFAWTAAVEALKRLDGLVRNSLAISSAVAQRHELFSGTRLTVEHLWMVLGIPTTVPHDVVKSLIKDIEHLKPSHPIIRATEAEIRRITEIMAGLISHDTNMYNKARLGLLDLVRNALTDVWTDTDAAKAAGIRTLVNKSLANLSSFINKGHTPATEREVDKYDTGKMTLDYTIVLTTISRQWSVKLLWGTGVIVNAVKSKVRMSSHAIKDSIRSVANSIKLGHVSSQKSPHLIRANQESR